MVSFPCALCVWMVSVAKDSRVGGSCSACCLRTSSQPGAALTRRLEVAHAHSHVPSIPSHPTMANPLLPAGKRYFTWDSAYFPTPARMQDDLASRGRKVRRVGPAPA